MKKFTAFILTAIMIFSVTAAFVSAADYDSKLVNEAAEIYSEALKAEGVSSFHGACNRANANQLLAAGIFKDGLDCSNGGLAFYTYYQNVKKTSGGYTATVIDGADCLLKLIESYGSKLYDIVYCLGTGGTSGDSHIMYIRAIEDGIVYFADSFGCYYDKYYPEGAGIALPVERFIAAYKSMNGDPFGLVYFTKDQPKPIKDISAVVKTYKPGIYSVSATATLFVRSVPSYDGELYGYMDMGEEANVYETKNNWGRIKFYGENAWICLDYTKYIKAGTPEMKITSVSANSGFVSAGSEIVWKVKTNADKEVVYSYYLYKDGELYDSVYEVDEDEFSFTPEEEGVYKLNAVIETVSEEEYDKATLDSYAVLCMPEGKKPIFGDINNDGKVNAQDARVALRISAMLESSDIFIVYSADVDRDGRITASDARKLLRYSAQLEALKLNF